MNKGITILLLLVVLGAMGMVMVSHISSRDETAPAVTPKPSATSRSGAAGTVAGRQAASSRENSVSDLIRIDPPLSSLEPGQQKPEGAPRTAAPTPQSARPSSGDLPPPPAASQPASPAGPQKTTPQRAAETENHQETPSASQTYRQPPQAPASSLPPGPTHRETPPVSPGAATAAGSASPPQPAQPAKTGTQEQASAGSQRQTAAPANAGTAGSQGQTAPASAANAVPSKPQGQTAAPASTIKADAAGPQGQTASAGADTARPQGQTTPAGAASTAKPQGQTAAPASTIKADAAGPQGQTASAGADTARPQGQTASAGAASTAPSKPQGQTATPAGTIKADAAKPPELLPPPAPASGKQPDANPAALSEKGTHNLKNISLLLSGDEAILRIEADSAFPCKTFVLTGPDRLVIDLPGVWKGMKTPPPQNNRIIRAVRMGQQSAGPRLVLDLNASLKGHKVERRGNVVDIMVR